MDFSEHESSPEVTQAEFLRQRIAHLEQENASLRYALTGGSADRATDSGRVATWTWKTDTNEVTGSPEFYSFRNLPAGGSLPYESWLETVHPAERAGVADALAAALRGERPYAVRFRVLNPRGDSRWIAAVAEVELDEQGRPVSLAGVDVDITGQEEGEDSRVQLASIVESSDDAIISKNLEGIVTSWNDGAERIFGYTAEEMIGMPIGVLCWPGHEDELSDILERIQCGERVSHFETVHRHKNGRAVYVSLTISPVRDGSGTIVGASRIARDISDRKRAEDALRDAEERYRDLFENSPMAVSVIDLDDGCFIDFNRMFCERLGYAPEEVQHLRLEEVALNYRALLMRALAEKRSGAQHVQFVTQYRTKGGELLDTLVTARPIRLDEHILIHSIAFDLSAQRRTEEALRQLREKESLLREIHHRVKNNLQVVSSLLGLQSRGLSDQQMRRVFQESQNRIHSMALLHESLYQSDNLSRVDFPAYVRQLAAYLFQSYGVRPDHVQLHTELEDVRLGMDAAVPCGLIINELLSNSLKYAFPEGRKGEVRITLNEDAAGRARLLVADNGVGIRRDVDWTRARSLGLRLVRTLAQQLDASLEIDSAAGTEVRLTFSAAA